MAAKAVAVIRGDATGTIWFNQEVSPIETAYHRDKRKDYSRNN